MKVKLSTIVLIITTFFALSRISYGGYNPPPPPPPLTVEITPPSGAEVMQGDKIHFVANAWAKPPAYIDRVFFEIYDSDKKFVAYGGYAIQCGGGYEFTWYTHHVPVDYYWVLATAYDDHGNKAFSSFAIIRINSKVSITSPVDHQAFDVGEDIHITASASPSSRITEVQFYVDGASSYVDDEEPYEYTWTSVPAGNHFVKAVACYIDGNTGTSDTAIFFVDAAPYVNRVQYIDVDATGANDGTTWDNAFNYLQDALDVAREGDQIWVADGNYYPDQDNIPPFHTPAKETESFILRTDMELYGGFAGGETSLADRDWAVNKTNLRGDITQDECTSYEDGSYHVVKVISADNVVLDGLTIMRGVHNFWDAYGDVQEDRVGSGIYINSSTCSLRNCTFSENSGGAYLNSSVCSLGNCIFTENGGNALGIDGGSLTIIDCNFVANGSLGSAIYNNGNIGSMTNCEFTENANLYLYSFGGAIYNDVDGNIQSIVDCKFSGNCSGVSIGEKPPPLGGAIYNKGHIQILDKCVFSGNKGYGDGVFDWEQADGWDAGGGAICNDIDADIQMISNCIFSENEYILEEVRNFAIWHGGGAICNNGEMGTIANCLFYKNRSSYPGIGGGAIYIGHNRPGLAAPDVINCTFFKNEFTCGITIWGGYTEMVLTNCIFWNDEDPSLPLTGNNLVANYCCIENYQAGSIPGVGNIGSDPQFVNMDDPNGPDNVLGTHDDGLAPSSPSSPCVDSGDNNVIGYADITDRLRFVDCIDRGAYEYQKGVNVYPPYFRITLNRGDAAVPTPILTIENNTANPLNFIINVSGDGL